MILQVLMNFETIIRLQGIASLLLMLAVLKQVQRDSRAKPAQVRFSNPLGSGLENLTRAGPALVEVGLV